MLIHAAENNKDLCNLYGLSSDSFSENGNPGSAAVAAAEGSGAAAAAAAEAAKRAALSASASHQLEAEKHRLALLQKVIVPEKVEIGRGGRDKKRNRQTNVEA